MRPERRALTVAAVLLAGCATLSEEQCRAVNWRELGERDGAQGYASSRLDAHREACSEIGVIPDEELYAQGREQGLMHYCEADNGYRLGRRGERPSEVCPRQLKQDFLDAHEMGFRTYETERELATTREDIERLESRLASDKNLSNEQRAYARRELNELYYEARYLRRRLDQLDDEWRLRGRAP